MFKYFRFYLVLVLYIYGSCTADDRKNSKIPPSFSESPEKRNQAALNFLSSAIRSNPAVAENYSKRALIYVELKNPQKAFEDIEEAISLKPNTGKYLYIKALVLNQLANYKSAFSFAQQAENLAFDKPELYLLMSELAVHNNDFRKADFFLAKSLQETPYNGEAYFWKSKMIARQKDTLSAIDFMLRSIDLKPRKIESYEALTEYYTQLGNYQEAKSSIFKGKTIFGNNINFLKLEANLFEKRGFLDSSLQVHERILVKAPEDEASLVKSVYIYTRWRSYFKAIELNAKLIEIDPKNDSYLYLMATLYEGVGSKLKAEEFYNETIKVNPSNNLAYNKLAMIRYSIDTELGIRVSKPVPKKPVEPIVLEEPKKNLDTAKLKVNIILPKNKPKISIDSNRFKKN